MGQNDCSIFKMLLFSILPTVQLTACDSDPCLNGGYCESDPQTPEIYECRCGDWFKGANCEGG